MKYLVAIVAPGLVSCTNLCQTIKDRGEVYSGVKLQDTSVYYSNNGKKYIKGQRYDFRRTFVDHPYSIGKKAYDQFEAIEGSGGETLYHEICTGKGGCVVYADNSEWLQLPDERLRAYPMKGKWADDAAYVSRFCSRRPTWHALYAYPLSAVSFVCVDLPLNTVGFAVATVISLPFMPGVIASQQQQMTVPQPTDDITVKQ